MIPRVCPNNKSIRPTVNRGFQQPTAAWFANSINPPFIISGLCHFDSIPYAICCKSLPQFLDITETHPHSEHWDIHVQLSIKSSELQLQATLFLTSKMQVCIIKSIVIF